MKRYIKSTKDIKYIGKFAIYLTPIRVDEMNDEYFVSELPGYAVYSVGIYNKDSDTIEGNILNHGQLCKLLGFPNLTDPKFIVGSVDITPIGYTELLVNNEDRLTEDIIEFLQTIFTID